MMRTIIAIRTVSKAILLAWLASLSPVSLAETYGSGWYRELQLAMGHEDNVSRSFRPMDLTDDTITSATFGLGYSQKLAENIQYVLSGYVSYNHHSRFKALSNVAASLGARAVYQPSASYHSIWYDTSVEVTRLDHKDSRERDGYFLSGSLSINKRLGMLTNGRIGYRYHDLAFLGKDDAQKRHDAAFDVARHEVFAGLDHEMADTVFLILEYGFQHGGFTSSASSAPPGSAYYEAQTADHAFKTCSALGCTGWYAYRSIADVHSADIGLAFAVGGIDYDLSARYIDARTDGDVSYTDWMIQFGLIWNF